MLVHTPTSKRTSFNITCECTLAILNNFHTVSNSGAANMDEEWKELRRFPHKMYSNFTIFWLFFSNRSIGILCNKFKIICFHKIHEFKWKYIHFLKKNLSFLQKSVIFWGGINVRSILKWVRWKLHIGTPTKFR